MITDRARPVLDLLEMIAVPKEIRSKRRLWYTQNNTFYGPVQTQTFALNGVGLGATVIRGRLKVI